MGETFYSALDVRPDADTAAIRRAYRDLVKTHHPDVSDDPGASETFKRLTTARDVLVDPEERDRYDRLGHESYVSQHLSGSTWGVTDGESEGADHDADAGAAAGGATAATAEASQREATADGGATAGSQGGQTGRDGSWWTQREAGGREERFSGREAHDQTRSGQWSSGDDEPSADYYHTGVGETTYAGSPGLIERLKGCGPWLAVHACFLLSAFATSWFLTGMILVSPSAPVGAVLLVLLLPVASAFLSFVHLAAIA